MIKFFIEKSVCEEPPDAPPNGRKKFNETRIIRTGHLVEYSCKNGWEVRGVERKECARNGSWVPEDEVECVKGGQERET